MHFLTEGEELKAISTPREFCALAVCLWDSSDGSQPDGTWYTLYPGGGMGFTNITLLVKETNPDPDNPLLCPPDHYDQLTEQVWRPVPPDGYPAFSDLS
ncbi:hypothetical protein ACF08B_37750 [Streptomyces sp. NPDC015139]|uniref:hypothetical protein n=1 Tax=Streptomyces sp. NPDC015139 TaxID=3364942 RepID=UPI0036FA3F77